MKINRQYFHLFWLYTNSPAPSVITHSKGKIHGNQDAEERLQDFLKLIRLAV